MNRFILFLVLSCFYSLSVFSQFQGIVLSDDNEPLNNVDVFLVEQNLLLKTNSEGVFLIEEIIPNNSYLEFYKSGYQSNVIQYKHGDPLKIFLKKLHVELDEIGIKESVSVLGNNKVVNIEKKSLNNNFILSTSLVDNLNQLPGINAIGSGLGIQKVVMRGLSGLRVVTYLNGMRIANQEWANDHSIGFTDLGLGKVELIKGASSLKLGGDAVGGVLYFIDEPFINSEIPSGFMSSEFDNSHFFFSNQFGLKWSRKNFYLNTNGEYSVSSDYRLPDNRYLFNSRFKNQAFKLSFGHLGDKFQNIFRYQYNSDQVGIPAHAHGNLSNVTLESITSSSLELNEDFSMTRPTQYISNHLFTFKTNYFSNKIKYSLFAGHFINNLQEFEKWTIPAFDMSLSTTTLRLNLDILLTNLNINSGVQYQSQQNLNNISSRLIPDSKSNDIGLYTIIDYEKSHFGFNGGFRLDYKKISCRDFDYNTLFSSINGAFGVFYELNNHITRLTYSGSYRAPHLSELFSDGLHHGTMRYEIGNVNLDIEKSHQIDFKYQWNNEHVGFVINPFIQFVNDFIAINPTDSFYVNTYRIYDYVQFNNVQISGCEVNFHYHPHFMHNLHIEQSYAFINTLNKDNNLFLARTPSNKIKTILNLDLISYHLPFGMKRISVYHVYSFAQEHVSLYETTSSAYDILNIALLLNPFKKTSLVFGVNNVFNKEYVPHLSRVKEIAQGVPNPGRSFNISLKYDF